MLGERSQLFRKVTIVGTGLMGGSVGMAIKKHHLAHEVIGVARQHTSLAAALKNRAIDRAGHDLKKSVQDADLVILATPAKTIIDLLPEVGKSAKRGAIITDMGSTKTAIVDAAQKHIPSHVFFVGSHPLAGSEKKGAVNSSAELFHNSVCVITPTEKSNKQAVDKVRAFWTKIGAIVKSLPPLEHDRILAHVSHLPHLLSFGLMNNIPQECLELAPQGLKDMTRIAASDPDMWSDICFTNSKNILQALDEYVKILAVFRKSIVTKDEHNLIESFKKSKNKRDSIGRS